MAPSSFYAAHRVRHSTRIDRPAVTLTLNEPDQCYWLYMPLSCSRFWSIPLNARTAGSSRRMRCSTLTEPRSKVLGEGGSYSCPRAPRFHHLYNSRVDTLVQQGRIAEYLVVTELKQATRATTSTFATFASWVKTARATRCLRMASCSHIGAMSSVHDG